MPDENVLDTSRIRRAKELFTLGNLEGNDVLLESFSRLSAELSTRTSVLIQLGGTGKIFQRITALANASRYTDLRLTELFARLRQIEWLDENLRELTEPVISHRRIFLGLAIKDFHVDAASLMDSLAPVVIQACGSLKPKHRDWLPGWSKLYASDKDSYRKELPNDFLETIDSTKRWWPSVRKVRDLLTHRDHHKLVFGIPTDGILFQVYEGTTTPTILDSRLLSQVGRNVADFRLYSAFVVGEILCLLDDLSRQIACKVNINLNGAPPSMLIGNFKAIAKAMDHLLSLF